MRIFKVIGVVLFLLCLSIPVFAEDETLIKGKIESTHIGSAELKFSPISGNSGIMIGGYSGQLYNSSYFFGSGGYILANRIQAPDLGPTFNTKNLYYNFCYYGFVFEYMNNPSKLVHLNGKIFVGPGFVNYVPSNFDFTQGPGSSYCLVIEPEVSLTLNVSESLRAGLSLGYRTVSGVNLVGLSNDDLSGLTVNLNFSFGEF